jgi:hypothetical protein
MRKQSQQDLQAQAGNESYSQSLTKSASNSTMLMDLLDVRSLLQHPSGSQ